MNLETANSQLRLVKIRVRGKRLSLRGTFPTPEGNKPKEIALRCPNTKEGIKIGLAKAKDIESQLLLGTWQEKQKDKRLTVAEAIVEFEKDYWKKWEKTDDRIKAWQKNQYPVFNYLPQDEIFNEHLFKKVFESLPPESYKQKLFVRILRPVGKFHNLKFDYTPFW